MDKLSNSFSLLELDSEDSKGESSIATIEQLGGADNVEGIENGLRDGTLLKNEDGNQQTCETTPGEYKMPLVWVDLEMTGLVFLGDPTERRGSVRVDEKSKRVECVSHRQTWIFFLYDRIILSWMNKGTLDHNGKTENSISPLSETYHVFAPRVDLSYSTSDYAPKSSFILGPDLVIHQTQERLDKMGEWCQEHHAESGLTERVLQSTISEQEAEKQVIKFVKRHVGTYTPLIAGNSVYMDLLFLRKYMPDLAALFSHVIVDVSSINALCLRWYPRGEISGPNDKKKAPQKENRHRAMDDIKESIAELKFYKEHIFKPKWKK